MRVLLIDNYDSYTFNLFQILGTHQPVVIRNDQFEWSFVKSEILPHFDCVIISPGPGRPDKREDFGICLDLLQNAHSISIPIFGVCLGHQGIGAVFGGSVVLADEPMHGRLSLVRHNRSHLFEGVDNLFSVVRYHSLVVDPKSLPDELEATAWTPSSIQGAPDVIMALQHRSLPLWGVQFHPESICTDFGSKLVDNFLKMAKQFWNTVNQKRDFHAALPPHIQSLSVIPTPLLESKTPQLQQYDGTTGFFKKIKTAHLQKLDMSFDLKSNFAEQVFDKCFGSVAETSRFWLDSAKVEKGMSRFSYMGACDSANSYVLAYSTETRTVTTTSFTQYSATSLPQIVHKNVILSEPKDTFFHYLARASAAHGFWSPSHPIPQEVHTPPNASETPQIPEFVCGYMGYFGYEMKCEAMPLPPDSPGFKTISAKTTPDSLFLFADRMIALDHATGSIWLITLEFHDETSAKDRIDWLTETATSIREIQDTASIVPSNSPIQTHHHHSTPTSSKKQYRSRTASVTLRDDKEKYMSNVESSLASIKQGETYEVCLTTKLALTIPQDPTTTNVSTDATAAHKPTSLEIYKRIRARNPAPYACFLQVPHLGLSVLQSSPERFLKSTGGVVEMKPIKGTVARPGKEGVWVDHAAWLKEDTARKEALQNNEKDRAENLMIVDLIRNDLNQISLPHSVHVPFLMHVESYATVHQLVSTIRCSLRQDLTPLDAIRATFPPGSMTGAPKLRTVEILEDLEGGPRGLYSGCLGFMSAGGVGIVDMSVVIRTAVMIEPVVNANGEKIAVDNGASSDKATTIEIGAGGAIVFLSDPLGEFEEMILKANSVLPSLKASYGIE